MIGVLRDLFLETIRDLRTECVLIFSVLSLDKKRFCVCEKNETRSKCVGIVQERETRGPEKEQKTEQKESKVSRRGRS